jgi:hypothetical protein
LAAAAVACGGTGGGTSRTPGPDAGEEVAVAEAGAPSGPLGFHYQLVEDQPFTYQRFDSMITMHPGGKTQVETFGRTAYLRVTLRDSLIVPAGDSTADSTDTLQPVLWYVARVVLDSIHQDPRSTMLQPALDSVRGASWQILMAPSGGVGTMTVDPGSTVGQSLSGELARLLYPRVPLTGVAKGAQWSDSSESEIGGLSVAQTERALTRYHVPEQHWDAVPTMIRIEGRARIERWGKEERGGRIIELEGTGVDSISFYFGAGGRFTGAEGADSVAMTFTIPAVGQSVPVYQIGRYRLSETPSESPEQAAADR